MVVTFNVTGGERGQWAVLQVSGELDLVTSPVLRQRVHDEVAEGRHSLVLDLSDVLFCDSSGVGVLIASRRLIRSCQGRLRLILPAQGAVDAPTSTASSARWACAGSSTATPTSPRRPGTSRGPFPRRPRGTSRQVRPAAASGDVRSGRDVPRTPT